MEFLTETVYLGNTLLQWILAGGLLVLTLAGLLLFRRVAIHRLQAFAARTRNQFDDALAALVADLKFLTLLLLALYVATRPLTLPAEGDAWFRAAALVVVLLQAGFWGVRLVRFGVDAALRRRGADTGAARALASLFTTLGRLVVWSAVVLLALDNLGVDVTTAIAGLGVSGIAVALALQSVLGDLFAALTILLDKPFEVGDFIIVGDLMGTVERIGVKTTRVRSLSGEELVFGNSDLLASRIRNYKRMRERRIVFGFGILYETPIEKLERIPAMVREIVGAVSDTRLDRVHFKAFGDSSLDFEVVYYMLVPDYNAFMDAQQAINLALVRRFQAEGIDFAYPTRTLYVQREGGAD